MTNPQNPLPPELQPSLDNLDQLIADLNRTLADQDWDALSSLNGQVTSAIEPLMNGLAAGQVDPELVRSRLEKLRQFVDAAGEGAAQAKAEAQQALKEVNQNSNAAKAYRNISGSRPK